MKVRCKRAAAMRFAAGWMYWLIVAKFFLPTGAHCVVSYHNVVLWCCAVVWYGAGPFRANNVVLEQISNSIFCLLAGIEL